MKKNCINRTQIIKLTFAAILILNFKISFSQCTPWTRKADFGGIERDFAVGFSIGTKGYIGTGQASDFWAYNPSTNTWTQRADVPGGLRYQAVGFSIGSKGYVGTGRIYPGGGYLNDFYEYDPVANTWTQKANISGVARSNAVGFSIGTKGYIGTGLGNSGPLNDFYEYDPSSNSWTQKANFGGAPRALAVGFSIGTKGYVGTGTSSISMRSGDFWEYDPLTNSWTRKVDLISSCCPDGTTQAVGFSINSRGYVGIGEGLGTRFFEYDPAANLWTQKADFPGSYRLSAAGFSIGNKGYIGTGSEGGLTWFKDFYEYDAAKDESVAITSSNISCFGAANGSASASVAGYSPPYNYLWSNGQTNSTATALTSGSYSVSVTNSIGCTYTANTTITQPAVLAASTTTTPSNCSFLNGSASVSASGGTAPYSYLWSNGQTSSTATGLSAGSYSVTITDSNNCNKTSNATVNYVTPATPSICVVTVDEPSNFNVIAWDKTGYNPTDTFIVYRDISNNNYRRIGAVPYDSLSQFIDTVSTLFAANGDPNVSSWRYKLSAKDSCGNESTKSPYHQTIFIQNILGNFIWNHYQIEGQGVPVPALQNYEVYRDNFSNGNWQIIQTLSASSTAFTDPNFNIFQNIASYRVQTQWNITCTPTLRMLSTINTTKSNTRDLRIIGPNSIREINAGNIFVSPNPFSESAILQITNNSNSPYEYIIYDIAGNEVMRDMVRNTSDYQIRRGSLGAGVYTLKVIMEKFTAVKKIVIQ